MATMEQYLDAIEKTVEVYNKIDENAHPAWKVTLGFYTALQIIDADFCKRKIERPIYHGPSDPPGPRSPLDKNSRNHMVWNYYSPEIYVIYISFFKLSRKSRYKPEYWHPIKIDYMPKVKKWLNEVFLPLKSKL